LMIIFAILKTFETKVKKKRHPYLGSAFRKTMKNNP
jgi:hypothetical protein